MSTRLDRSKLLYLTDRKQWRAWLRKHFKSETEAWLVYAKKHTGRPSIAYNDAVEEALCFGWIDSTVRSLDGDSYAQRFTPRRPGSAYSQANQERLRALVKQGKVSKEVLPSLNDLNQDTFSVPPDILRSIKANKRAWTNFRAFSPSYVRIRIAFIEGARRRPQEFKKRLAYFIKMTEENKTFGYGGVERYY